MEIHCIGSDKAYVMGTKYPHKDGNIQKPCPCEKMLTAFKSYYILNL